MHVPWNVAVITCGFPPLQVFRVFPDAAAGANVILSGGQAWVPLDNSIYGQASAMSYSATAGKETIRSWVWCHTIRVAGGACCLG